MAQATFSVRMDSDLKNEFEALCGSFGMNVSTAINVFARAVVREKRIPFEISAVNPSTRERGLAALLALRESAKANGVDMSMDEIDEEIRKARHGE